MINKNSKKKKYNKQQQQQPTHAGLIQKLLLARIKNPQYMTNNVSEIKLQSIFD